MWVSLTPTTQKYLLSRLTHRAELFGGVPIFSLDANLERPAAAFMHIPGKRSS